MSGREFILERVFRRIQRFFRRWGDNGVIGESEIAVNLKLRGCSKVWITGLLHKMMDGLVWPLPRVEWS